MANEQNALKKSDVSLGESTKGGGGNTQGNGGDNPSQGNDNPGHGGNNPGQGGGNPGQGGADKKISLIVIVNGTSVTEEANPHQKLQVVAQKALEDSGNTGRPLADWTLKTRDGVPLDMGNTVESYGLSDGTQLVLSLDAGIGG
jgi:hypothetical protein